jgi:signal transduction histidine kinase
MKDEAPRNGPPETPQAADATARTAPPPAASRPLWPHLVAVPGCVGAAVLAALALPIPLAVILAMFMASLTAWSAAALFARIRASEQERCSLDAQLVQSQKLAAIGEMSAGIAHEINNPMAIIAQESDWMTHLMSQPEVSPENLAELRDSLAEIVRQVDRCKAITHNLLNFSRKMEPILQEEHLERIMEDMVLLVEKEARLKGVTILRDFDADLPAIRTDVPLLRQVILNLLINAFQAIPGAGTITVSTRPAGPSQVAIAVADTGAGISPENMSKIFNPFFTTKPPGVGTGLGLSMCHGIVDRLGGTITAHSAPGQGATFTVTLPR